MRSTKTLIVIAALAAALPAQWAQLSLLTTFPSQRRAGAAAFDATANRLIFLGGVSPTPSVILPETWAFNGTWTLLNPPGGTVGRWGHQLVRNTTTNRLFTFGGRSPTISGFANDAMEWTGTQWQALTPPVRPQARFQYGMCFDSTRNVMVLFGGRNANTTFGDTWEFDGVNWTERSLTNPPPPREEMAMVYDPELRRTILFGGHDSDTATILGDTWLYDGVEWQPLVLAPAQTPSARYRGASVMDTVRKRAVLYGGFDGTLILRDTYEFTGSAWQQVTTGINVPQASTETLHGYDPVRRKFVLFGGFGGSFSSQTWEYTGTTTGLFSEYGAACATVNGDVAVTSSTPRIGQTWTLTYDNLPLNTLGMFVVYGFSNTVWNAQPLPFDLGVIGLPGCSLLASADVTNFVLATNGATAASATIGLPIPNNVAFLNTTLYTQGVVLDLVGPDITFPGTTRGGRAIIGN